MLKTSNCYNRWRSVAVSLALAVGAAVVARAAEPAATLPSAVQAALTRAGVPLEAVAIVISPVEGGATRLNWRADQPMVPASVMKLTTTFAALDLLGPAYTWKTPVYVDGPVRAGTLQGNLYVRGSGDPSLVLEQLWLLLRRVQAYGIRNIAGDIVLDNSAFAVPAMDPAAFDGEPLRPYNAGPEALLINFKSLVLTIVPDAPAGVARIQSAPPLSGYAVPDAVTLAPPGTVCGDWRSRLQRNVSHPQRLGFDGTYPASCGERTWALAPPEPEQFSLRAVAGMWAQLGGQLTGAPRQGAVPAGLLPLFTHASAPLVDTVQSVNKYSNNVMAQQLFLTVGLEQGGLGSAEAGRSAMQAWWQKRMGGAPMPIFDNGSGLSREARITAAALARLLQMAWASPVMPELMASLPIVGVDGTLRRSKSRAVGAAHLKTGSLRDVSAVAGYVLDEAGRRWALVVLVNHPNASAARPAIDALIDWTAGPSAR